MTSLIKYGNDQNQQFEKPIKIFLEKTFSKIVLECRAYNMGHVEPWMNEPRNALGLQLDQ